MKEITKTNLFLRTKDKEKYDCIILGSSRAIALRASEFAGNNCFNYALKGGEIPDFVNYAKFLQEQGINPKIVYIGVDGLNFVEKERTEQKANSHRKSANWFFLRKPICRQMFYYSRL